MGAVVQYAKTRPVFDGYKAARYSKKYLAQHEAELSDYRAAKAAMSDLLGGAKLPKMDALKKTAAGTGGQEKSPLCRVPGGTEEYAGGRGGQGEHRSSADLAMLKAEVVKPSVGTAVPAKTCCPL